MRLWKSLAPAPCAAEILLDELFVEGLRVQQAGALDREEGLVGAGGKAGVDQVGSPRIT